VTVKLELPPAVVILHFVNALLLMTAVLVTALRAHPSAELGAPTDRHRTHGLAWTTALVGFAAVLLGANVANLDAGPACLGFPFCHGGILPPSGTLGLVHWIHRFIAYGFLALAITLFVKLSLSVVVAAGLALIQIGIAAAMVLQLLPPSLRGFHLLAGTAIWGVLVVMVHHSGRGSAPWA
jgi:heme A synthase